MAKRVGGWSSSRKREKIAVGDEGGQRVLEKLAELQFGKFLGIIERFDKRKGTAE
jgi:hypothetical protein